MSNSQDEGEENPEAAAIRDRLRMPPPRPPGNQRKHRGLLQGVRHLTAAEIRRLLVYYEDPFGEHQRQGRSSRAGGTQPGPSAVPSRRKPRSTGPSNSVLAQVAPSRTGFSQPGDSSDSEGSHSQAGPGQSGSLKPGPSKDGLSQACPGRTGSLQLGPSRDSLSQAGPSHLGIFQAGSSQRGLPQTGLSLAGSSTDVSPPPDNLQPRPSRLGPCLADYLWPASAKNRSARAGPALAGTSQASDSAARAQPGPSNAGLSQESASQSAPRLSYQIHPISVSVAENQNTHYSCLDHYRDFTTGRGGGFSVSRRLCRHRHINEERIIVLTSYMESLQKKLETVGTSNSPEYMITYFVIHKTLPRRICQYHVRIRGDSIRNNVYNALRNLHRRVMGRPFYEGILMYNLSEKVPAQRLLTLIKKPDNPYYLKIVVKGDVTEYLFVARHGVMKMSFMLVKDIELNVNQFETVMQILEKYRKRGAGYKKKFTQHVRGKIILSAHDQQPYTVEDVFWDLSPNSELGIMEPKITFKEYYNQKYKQDIKKDCQPLLLARTFDPYYTPTSILLMPEICHFTGVPDTHAPDYVDMSHEVQEMVTVGPSPPHWVVITPVNLLVDTKNCMNFVLMAGRASGFQMNDPEYVTVPRDRRHYYVSKCEELIATKKPKLIVAVLHRKCSYRISGIMEVCSVKNAIHVKVIIARSLKLGAAVASKIAFEIECKLNGAPWSIDVPLQSLLAIGCDMCMDSNRSGMYYGGFVANVDRNIRSFYSVSAPHRSNVEMSDNLACFVIEAVNKYREINGVLPSPIFIYRAGVSRVQRIYLIRYEIPLILLHLSAIYGDIRKEMVFILVSSSLHAWNAESDADPGSCLNAEGLLSWEEDVGANEYKLFTIIYDGTTILSSLIKSITADLFNTSYNCAGNNIYVPSVWKSARSLARLSATTLHSLPNEGLKESLHYL